MQNSLALGNFSLPFHLRARQNVDPYASGLTTVQCLGKLPRGYVANLLALDMVIQAAVMHYEQGNGWAVKRKGTAIPVQTWTGPEGSRRVRLPDFKTVRTWRW